MPEKPSEEEIEIMAKQLEADLLDLYGPLLTGDDLRKALGYVSKDAFRQAMARKTVPIPLFELENRRGKYALSKDVAKYLARRRVTANGREGGIR